MVLTIPFYPGWSFSVQVFLRRHRPPPADRRQLRHGAVLRPRAAPRHGAAPGTAHGPALHQPRLAAEDQAGRRLLLASGKRSVEALLF